MTDVALIACDHGLGHVRRCALVAEALSERGASVTLLAPRDAVARVRRGLGIDTTAVTDVEFRTHTSAAALRAGDARTTRWEQRLPDLGGFDRVVADTLPEVLAVRPDTVLLAQFVWHEVLDGVDATYRARAAALLDTATTIVGDDLFAMPALRERQGFVGVGRYVPATVGPPTSPPSTLLVSGGTTPAVVAPLRRLVAALQDVGPGSFRRVVVDEELAPSGPPPWMEVAGHDRRMYDDVALAVVRPGLGVLSELVARGVPAWCAREPGNAELAHNAAAVSGSDLGRDLGTVPGGTDAVERWAADVAATAVAAGTAGWRPTGAGPTDGAAAAARTVLA